MKYTHHHVRQPPFNQSIKLVSFDKSSADDSENDVFSTAGKAYDLRFVKSNFRQRTDDRKIAKRKFTLFLAPHLSRQIVSSRVNGTVEERSLYSIWNNSKIALIFQTCSHLKWWENNEHEKRDENEGKVEIKFEFLIYFIFEQVVRAFQSAKLLESLCKCVLETRKKSSHEFLSQNSAI